DFDPYYQPGVDDLLDGIQSEFSETIYAQSTPKIRVPLPVKYWMALHNDILVGTVGVATLSNNNVALKRMMVQKDYRGRDIGLSDALLDIALKHSISIGAKKVFLGTMTQ